MRNFQVTQKLGLTRYAIGGNSMGGGVAAQYTETWPDEVSALILVDAAGIPRKPQPGAKIPLAFRLAQTPVLNKLLLYVTPRSIIAEGLHKVFVDQSKVTDEMVESVIALEKSFEVKLSPKEITKNSTINDIVSNIEAKLTK